jgi:hypothetical protein
VTKRALSEPRRGWHFPHRFRDPKLGDFKIEVDPAEETAALGEHFELPRRFTIDPRDVTRPLIDIEVEDGKAACVALRRRPNGPPLKTVTVRQPVDAFVRAAIYVAAIERTDRTVEGETVWAPASGRLRRSQFERQARRGARLTDEFLRTVAQVYREETERSRPPTQGVAERLYGSRASAGRWVMEARRRGFLGDALPGRAGERKR